MLNTFEKSKMDAWEVIKKLGGGRRLCPQDHIKDSEELLLIAQDGSKTALPRGTEITVHEGERFQKVPSMDMG